MDVQARTLAKLSNVAGYSAGPPPVATPGVAGTPFFTTALVIPADVQRAYGTIALSAAAKVLYKRNNGTAQALNANAALGVSTPINFCIPVSPGDTLNFQLDTNVNVQDFDLDGLPAGNVL